MGIYHIEETFIFHVFFMLAYLKLFHVLFMFTWLGSLLVLTRLMAFPSNQGTEAQLSLGKMCRKMYFYLDLPSMLFALTLGAFLLFWKGIDWRAGWLHMKLTFAFLLVVCDSITGWEAVRLSHKVVLSKRWGYKILHIMVFLCLLGALASIYLFKNRGGY